MSDAILDHLQHRVLLADGGMGTRVQGMAFRSKTTITAMRIAPTSCA